MTRAPAAAESKEEPTMIERPLTKKEAAEFLRVGERTIDRYRSEGILRAVKGRGKVVFQQEELQRFLNNNMERCKSRPRRSA